MLNCHVTHFKLSLCNPLDFKFVIVLHHLSICPISIPGSATKSSCSSSHVAASAGIK